MHNTLVNCSRTCRLTNERGSRDAFVNSPIVLGCICYDLVLRAERHALRGVSLVDVNRALLTAMHTHCRYACSYVRIRAYAPYETRGNIAEELNRMGGQVTHWPICEVRTRQTHTHTHTNNTHIFFFFMASSTTAESTTLN